MSEFKIKKAINIYFDILCTEGIPEESVVDFTVSRNSVHVITIENKHYSRQLISDEYLL